MFPEMQRVVPSTQGPASCCCTFPCGPHPVTSGVLARSQLLSEVCLFGT